MILTPDQIQELLNIISYNITLFSLEHIGWDILSSEDINLLKKNGIKIEKYFGKDAYIDYSYKFGIISDTLRKQDVQKMTFEDIKNYIKSSKFIPLTQQEKDVLHSIKHQSFKDIKGLGNKIKAGTEEILIDIDKNQRIKNEKIIRKEAEKTIIERQSVRDFALRLAKKTGDWSRDWGRIADFILHQSFDEGRTASILRKSGEDTLVYKDVFAGVCKDCERLLTTKGFGSYPIIFTLDQLIKNNTNIGKKVKDWKAVVGPLHPFCRCTINELPQDKEWNTKTGQFDIEKEYVRKIPRKSSVKIEIK